MAIPVRWVLLDKRGNSNTQERIDILAGFIKQFGKASIRGVLADREFIGEKWFKYLKKQEINFIIRIKKDAKTTSGQGREVQVKSLFRHLKAAEHCTIEEPRLITGVWVYLTALRLSDGELLIIASSKNDGRQALEYYKERWQIETLFGCLKSRGFNLEETRVTDLERIKKLLIVPAIAFCWAHRTGEWQHDSVKPIKVKKHLRLSKSIFRVGLDFIRNALFNATPSCNLATLFQFIDFNNFYSSS
jgi:transposase